MRCRPMSVQTNDFFRLHTLQAFDGELNLLRSQVVDMAGLVMFQLEQTMQAMHEADMELALDVIERDSQINRYEVQIDDEVVQVLARHSPVANDLRAAISISKIAYELEKIGNEIALFAKLVSVLFDPNTSDPNPKLLADIVKIGNLVKIMLTHLMRVFDEGTSVQAYQLLQCDSECEIELQEGIRHQLSFVLKDARFIGRAMDIMQIMKTLERCGEHSRNIAEYMIYMIEGIDVRHPNRELNIAVA